MERDERKEVLLTIAAQELDVDRGRLSLETTRDDLEEWDSLAHLELCMAVERRFGARLSTEDVGKYTSLAQIYERLEQG